MKQMNNIRQNSIAIAGGAFGGLARIFRPINPRGLPTQLKGLAKYGEYFRLDPSHHGKG